MPRFPLLLSVVPWLIIVSAGSFEDVALQTNEFLTEEAFFDPMLLRNEVFDFDPSKTSDDDGEDDVAWSEYHRDLMKIKLKGHSGSPSKQVPFHHGDEPTQEEQFDPNFLESSFSETVRTIDGMNSKGSAPDLTRQNPKSPTPDLIREALEYAYAKLAHVPHGAQLEEDSSKEKPLKLGETSRSRKTFEKGDEPELMEYATQYLKTKLGNAPTQVSEEVITQALNESTMVKSRPSCQAGYDINCHPSRYRSIDGTCNNLKIPTWGAADTCQVRLLPAFYQDGISEMRGTSVTGKALPSGLFLATRLLCEEEKHDSTFNAWSLAIGKLLAHDLGYSPPSREDCCPNPDLSECLNFFTDPTICMPPGAPCIYEARTESCSQCKLGPRNLINRATSFLDLSPVYGSDPVIAKSLRLGKDGLMAYDLDEKGGMILPESGGFNSVFCESARCVAAGDERAVQQPAILLSQNTFLRFHNRIAIMLANLHPGTPDEILFQETRRVVIMHWQRIIYEEYLPSVLGPQYYFYYGIDGLKTQYNSQLNPGAIVEVLVAALRFGHTMIKSFFKLKDKFHDEHGLRLKPHYFNANPLFKGQVNYLSAGSLQQPAAKTDVCFAHDVTQNLYWTLFDEHSDVGYNLAAANIERGRDHGVAPYPAYIRFCFGTKIDSWDDLKSIMSTKNIARLRSFYKSVWDVDLWVGGIHETPLEGGLVGPTFGCLLGIQFYNSKFGDRYFYTHHEKKLWYPVGLNIGQSHASPLHNLICLTSELDSVLERPLEIKSQDNKFKSCDYLQSKPAKPMKKPQPQRPMKYPIGHH